MAALMVLKQRFWIQMSSFVLDIEIIWVLEVMKIVLLVSTVLTAVAMAQQKDAGVTKNAGGDGGGGITTSIGNGGNLFNLHRASLDMAI